MHRSNQGSQDRSINTTSVIKDVASYVNYAQSLHLQALAFQQKQNEVKRGNVQGTNETRRGVIMRNRAGTVWDKDAVANTTGMNNNASTASKKGEDSHRSNKSAQRARSNSYGQRYKDLFTSGGANDKLDAGSNSSGGSFEDNPPLGASHPIPLSLENGANAGGSMLSNLVMQEKQKSAIANGDQQQTEDKVEPKTKGKKTPSVAKAQPFDFKFIKILIKKSNEKECKEVLLERDWVIKNNTIPHFANVIKNVDKNEGVEITMNCNASAFDWIIEFVKIKTTALQQIEDAQMSIQGLSKDGREDIQAELDGSLYEKMDQVDNENCLNILVTSYFLQLNWVYEKVWKYYFERNFSEVINQCRISLSNINPQIVKDIASRIPELFLENMQERKDKFISNIYKARIDYKILLRDNKEEQDKSKHDLYWCDACENLMTQEQALKISCVNYNPESGNDCITSYRSRKSSSTIVSSLSTHDQSPSNTDRLAGQLCNVQDKLVLANGQVYTYHNIIFKEEVTSIARDRLKDKEKVFEPVKATPCVNIEAFIKFFREKYRLCWKEIYLKFSALTYKTEKCINCREFFQLSQIGGCKYNMDKDGSKRMFLKQQAEWYQDLTFHEVDLSNSQFDNANNFTQLEFNIFKQEFQVIDNIHIPLDTQSKIELEAKKGFDHVNMMVAKYKDTLDFVEPQSMNFDIKINKAYKDFEQQNKNNNKNQIKQQNLLGADQCQEGPQEMFDDILYEAPIAKKQVNKLLNSAKYMRKLYAECEAYFRENEEEFAPPKTTSKIKFDLVENTIDKEKAKKQKQGLETHQAAQVQELLVKRFSIVRKDIIMADDFVAQKQLCKLLAALRVDMQENSFFPVTPGSRMPSANQGSNMVKIRKASPLVGNRVLKRAGSPNPVVGARDGSNVGHKMSNTELAQAGVKIYSDLKDMITVKKSTTQKMNGVQNSGGAARKNFLQRNKAMSTGNRSGSNNGQPGAGVQPTNIPPIIRADSRDANLPIAQSGGNSNNGGSQNPVVNRGFRTPDASNKGFAKMNTSGGYPLPILQGSGRGVQQNMLQSFNTQQNSTEKLGNNVQNNNSGASLSLQGLMPQNQVAPQYHTQDQAPQMKNLIPLPRTRAHHASPNISKDNFKPSDYPPQTIQPIRMAKMNNTGPISNANVNQNAGGGSFMQLQLPGQQQQVQIQNQKNLQQSVRSGSLGGTSTGGNTQTATVNIGLGQPLNLRITRSPNVMRLKATQITEAQKK